MSSPGSLENTAELNFKFQETTSELNLLRSEYRSQSEIVQKLEEDLMQKQSSIESMKLALNYYSNYEIVKETDYKTRIEELEKNLKVTRKEKEKINTSFSKQIDIKNSYIEDLLTTMLNLHQKIEYYKDDLVGLKKSLELQTRSCEKESSLREKAELMFQESLREIEKYKKSYTEMKHKSIETEAETEEIVKNLKSEYEHEYIEETHKLSKNYDHKIQELSDEYNYRISVLEKNNKEVTENLSKYMNARVENMRCHYENRIIGMIKEYSLQEAKFQSKLANMTSILSNIQDKYQYISDDLVEKNSTITIINEERKELLNQKQELDKILFNLQIDTQYAVSNATAKLEETKKQMQTKQEDLKKDYEFKMKLISKEKSIKIEAIKSRYERKLLKLTKNNEENSEKLKNFHKRECENFLEMLSKLETEKTEIIINLEQEVRTLSTTLKRTVLEYEEKLSSSKDNILRDFQKERDLIINDYKLRLHEQSKEFALERKSIEETTENAYKKIISNLKQEFNQEKLEIFQDNLNKMDHVQNLCKRKCDHLENQLSIVKKSFYEESERWGKIVDDKENLLKKIEKEYADLELELDREKVKVLKMTHDKDQMAKENNEKIHALFNSFNERELEISHKFDCDKKHELAKVLKEKHEDQLKYEKTINLLNEKIDALNHRYKMLEKKKKDIFLKENQHTIQRYVNEITERNKIIDHLNKEIGKLKVQIKYVGETVKIFTDDKLITTTHRKVASDLVGNTSIKRPSSSGGHRTFKF